MRYYVHQFSDKMSNFEFLAQIGPKMDFWLAISKIQVWIWNQHLQYTMCANFQSKQITFNFFDLNLGKLPNYMQYFGSDVVEGVLESWMEAEMS